MRCASTIVPVFSRCPREARCALISPDSVSPRSCFSSRWRKFRIVVSSGGHRDTPSSAPCRLPIAAHQVRRLRSPRRRSVAGSAPVWLAPLSCSARQDRNKLAFRITLTYILISILFNLTISSPLSNRFNGIRNDFRSGVGSAPTDCPADPSHRCPSHAPSLDVGLNGHQRERTERTAPRRCTPCCFAYTISGRLEWGVTLSCPHDNRGSHDTPRSPRRAAGV